MADWEICWVYFVVHAEMYAKNYISTCTYLASRLETAKENNSNVSFSTRQLLHTFGMEPGEPGFPPVFRLGAKLS